MADYYFEVQRFDSDVDRAIKRLEAMGAIDNTIVVVTGDHGMPFPRCKANVYDSGARVPMAVQWPAKLKFKNRIVTDFVSTTDLAPTFLDLAGVEIPEEMTGKSWRSIFESERAGRVDANRDHVLIGKERHVPAQEGDDHGGYPIRAIRTDKYLLIHNYRPDRWPAGTPDHEKAFMKGRWLGDCDNGPSKTYIVENKDKDEMHRRAYRLAFDKRPEFELYDLARDPDQLVNVAGNSDYETIQTELADQLRTELLATSDPRETGSGIDELENAPYFGGGPKHPKSSAR